MNLELRLDDFTLIDWHLMEMFLTETESTIKDFRVGPMPSWPAFRRSGPYAYLSYTGNEPCA